MNGRTLKLVFMYWLLRMYVCMCTYHTMSIPGRNLVSNINIKYLFLMIVFGTHLYERYVFVFKLCLYLTYNISDLSQNV